LIQNSKRFHLILYFWISNKSERYKLNLKKKFHDWVESKFLFVIRKEQDFAVVTSFSVSAFSVVLIFVLLFFTLFGISLVLSKTLLQQWFDPEYAETENLSKILMLSETVDSLAVEIAQKDLYVLNLQRIITGDDDFVPGNTMDTASAKGAAKTDIRSFEASEETKIILDEFRGSQLDFGSARATSSDAFSQTYFFPPLKGLVTAAFEPQKNHFGVDVVTKENEPVKTIADGSVFFTSWTLETGYVIAVQHANELISIYKHNSVLLKTVGDVVRGGEILSIIGNTGELTSGQHLHFEMWYRGTPLNPQEFITFN
jgi:murein DD-endopeptidase MepM/ murein hydrolase activator NlpD